MYPNPFLTETSDWCQWIAWSNIDDISGRLVNNKRALWEGEQTDIDLTIYSRDWCLFSVFVDWWGAVGVGWGGGQQNYLFLKTSCLFIRKTKICYLFKQSWTMIGLTLFYWALKWLQCIINKHCTKRNYPPWSIPCNSKTVHHVVHCIAYSAG